MWSLIILFCGLALVQAETFNLNPNTRRVYDICGTANVSTCNDLLVTYTVTATLPINVYFLDASQYASWTSPSITPSCYAAYSCPIATTFCNVGTFTPGLAVAYLGLYNPSSNSSNVTLTSTSENRPRTILAVGAIAGIVVGAVVVLLAVTLALWWCACCRRAGPVVILADSEISMSGPPAKNLLTKHPRSDAV